MKKKIVIWGQNEKDEKILIGLELKDKDSKVLLYTIDEASATEAVYKSLMDDWREGKEVTFPESTVIEERPLTLIDDILPETIRTDRTDIITRAKAEWHFVVLSSKLYDMYQTEVDELKDKVDNLSQYDDKVWAEMKSFWDKVQGQVRDKNLFREHANNLRKHTNALFDSMKTMKDDLQKEFKEQSKTHYAEFTTMLDTIQEKLDKELGLKPIFEELKTIQNKFKDTKFSRDHGNKIWNRLDAYFKTVKDRKYGGNSSQGNNDNALSRVQRRYDGLMHAIGKMDSSINKDKRDLEYQKRRINETNGQLEQQLGQAKIMMIEERMNSKQEKLDDMLKTKDQLDKKIEKEKLNAEKRAKEAEVELAKQARKAEIAAEMSKASEARDEAKLAEIAEKVNEGKSRGPKKKIAVAPVVLEATESDTEKTTEVNIEEVVTETSKKEEVKVAETNIEVVKSEDSPTEDSKSEEE